VTNCRVRRNCSMESSSAWRGFTVLRAVVGRRSGKKVSGLSLPYRATGMDLMVRIPDGGAPDRSRSFELGANGTMVPHCRSVRLGNPAVPGWGIEVVNEWVSTAHPFDPDAKFKHVLV